MSGPLLYRRAVDQLGHGQVDAAIETLAQLLGDTPDDAAAHSLLAICLVRRKRLHAARLEAEAGLALAPEDAFAHRAMAEVLIASRRFDDALAHLEQARAADPEDGEIEAALAWLYLAWDRADAALPHAGRARELDPDSAQPLVLLATIARQRGDRAGSARLAAQALAMDPESVDALVLAGHAALAAGDVDAAREHAAWALQHDPQDEGALELLCATKARRSLWLGLWWRFQSFVVAGGSTRAIAIVVGLFLVYKAASILLAGHGRQDIADAIRIGWLAFCVYSWVAPEVFLRQVRRELEQVRLRPDF